MTVDNFVLTNDQSKLTLTESTKSSTATTLLWYSNKELYALVDGEEKCLYVDEEEKLFDLNGQDVKYDKDNVKGVILIKLCPTYFEALALVFLNIEE